MVAKAVDCDDYDGHSRRFSQGPAGAPGRARSRAPSSIATVWCSTYVTKDRYCSNALVSARTLADRRSTAIAELAAKRTQMDVASNCLPSRRYSNKAATIPGPIVPVGIVNQLWSSAKRNGPAISHLSFMTIVNVGIVDTRDLLVCRVVVTKKPRRIPAGLD